MAGHRFVKLIYDDSLTDTFTLSATGTQIVDVDLNNQVDAQFLIESVYGTTGSTTGYSLEVRYGFGQADPDATGPQLPCVLGGAASSVLFSDNGDTVTIATITPSSSNVTKRTFFTTNDLRQRVPRWLRLYFTNLDPANSATIRIYGDV